MSKWVPRARLAPEITLRRLLNHTSGLFGIDENPVYSRAVDRAPHRRWTAAETLRYVRRPYFPPGKGWHYSDTNYVLAGLAIERATGSRVGSQMKTLLLEPHGLDRTGLQPEDDPPPDAAHGHGDPAQTGTIRDLTRGMRWVPYDSLASSEWASGGMYATAEEVARFGDALFTGKVVKRATVNEMTTWVSATLNPYIGYGLGIEAAVLRGPRRRALGVDRPRFRLWSRSVARTVPRHHASPCSPTTSASTRPEIADVLLRETIQQR